MISFFKRKTSPPSGFTTIELLVAISVFSLMLLLTSGVMVELGRQFHKGNVSSRTQEVSRVIIDEISNNIQYSASDPYQLPPSGSVNHWCIAGRLYSYVLDQELSPSNPNVLLRSTDCSTPPSEPLQRTSSDQVELLADSMRITEFSLQEQGKVWRIAITVAHGDDDVFDPTVPAGDPPRCRAGAADSTYCAVSSLSTVVVRKL